MRPMSGVTLPHVHLFFHPVRLSQKNINIYKEASCLCHERSFIEFRCWLDLVPQRLLNTISQPAQHVVNQQNNMFQMCRLV